jgi:chromosome partitioning protein
MINYLPMKIITIAHQKGGVGKTTLALNLAHCFRENNLKVGMTDTDVQGSILDLETWITGIDLLPLEKVLAKQFSTYEVIIIDTPPYLTNQLADLFALTDFVLVPTKAGFLDILAIKATVALIKQAQAKRPHIKAGIVLNMLMPRTTLNDEITAMLQHYDLPLLKTGISQRVSYTRSPITNGIFESDDKKAKDEITALATEILAHLNA